MVVVAVVGIVSIVIFEGSPPFHPTSCGRGRGSGNRIDGRETEESQYRICKSFLRQTCVAQSAPLKAQSPPDATVSGFRGGSWFEFGLSAAVKER